LGRYADAERCYKGSLAVAEHVLGKDDPEVGTVLHTLGTLYVLQERFADAEAPLARALAIRRANAASDPFSVMATMHMLADVEEAAGKPDQALALHREMF